MEHKIIDLVCGDLPTMISLKSLDIDYKNNCSIANIDEFSDVKKPLFSGENNNYANAIFINDKVDIEKLNSGISYNTMEVATDTSNTNTKVFNQSTSSPDNPYNFLSKSLVV